MGRLLTLPIPQVLGIKDTVWDVSSQITMAMAALTFM